MTSSKKGKRLRKPAQLLRFSSDGYSDGQQRLMTNEEFRLVSKEISAKLRKRTDPPPRMMQHGCGHWSTPCTNVETLLSKRASSGSILLRGFKIFSVSIDQSECMVERRLWKAVSHVVVAHPPINPSKSLKWLYECATAPEDIADRRKNFLFVPSTRAHTDLTDEQLLRGEWHLCTIIGGDMMFAEMISADNSNRGRERSMIVTSPEQCVAKRRQLFGFFPHFERWYAQQKRRLVVESVAELMGFPCVDRYESACNPLVDFFDDDHIDQSLKNNVDALVDGGRMSVDLNHDTCVDLYTSKTTIEQTSARWFMHYDYLLAQIEQISDRRYHSALCMLGLK